MSLRSPLSLRHSLQALARPSSNENSPPFNHWSLSIIANGCRRTVREGSVYRVLSLGERSPRPGGQRFPSSSRGVLMVFRHGRPSPRTMRRRDHRPHLPHRRGMSFPLSNFCSEVLEHYGLQPFHLPPNSITTLSGFVAFCEGYLGIRPRLDLFSFYY
jgi:hypothetical protein